MTTTLITSLDCAEFARLPATVRDDVSLWRSHLESLTPPVTHALRGLAAQLGVSYQTALRRYYDYHRSGWRGLINRVKCPQLSAVTLPADFIEHWKMLCERNQRKCKPAYRQLLRDWHAGRAIPGYEDSNLSRTTLPPGWSYSNLMRHAPTKFELAVTRIGRSGAANFRPLVYTTRANLWVGSHYLFDDLWHDLFVNVLDTRKTGRPLEFHALDLYSACKFAWGMRVRTEASDGTMEGLTESMMRYLLAYVLSEYGYSSRGTTLVVEHGTAAIRDALERTLSDCSGGLITVARSGMDGAAAFAGQYAGRAKGNFRFKAALESLGNLIHNELAALPAQTGMDLSRRPEQLHGLLKRNDALLNAVAALPPEQAQLLRLDVIEFRQFQLLAMEIYRRINSRTDHDLEGWSANVAYDTTDRASSLIPHPSSFPRRMSPQEVWDRDRRDLIPLPPAAIALILGPDLGVERSVRRYMIEFQDKELGPDLHRYEALNLVEGEKYLTIVNPFAPSQLYAFDARGGLAGVCSRIASVDRADTDALHRAMGRAARIESELLAPVARRGAALTRQRIEDARHNSAVLAGDPAAHRAPRALRGASIDDFVSLPTSETPTEEPAGVAEQLAALDQL